MVQETPVKRLCKTHKVITVNGQLPGPTIEVREGDTLEINVVNRARYNAWSEATEDGVGRRAGVRDAVSDQAGGSYKYRFTIEGQVGTLWWHAHSSWLRATVYGALIIHPKGNSSYPFTNPQREFPILLDTTTIPVKAGETNLLRFINAALNTEMFVAIANHKMTVVGVDASYTKPFTTSVLLLGPGQTTDVLVTTDQPAASYYIAARAYASTQGAPLTTPPPPPSSNMTAAALHHPDKPLSHFSLPSRPITILVLSLPLLPALEAYQL
uniref:Laccase n=1 Tax=Ananas comosus var. bracteatus TaxID=296719 RepID=A0A6V7NGI3_ANACO|nr:unnamed protein product [Ananas comosus var. bracteatus]